MSITSADCWSKRRGGRPEYSVDRNRVLMGCTVVAWLRGRRGRFDVVAVGGPLIGVATSPAEAMLMAMRHRENPR